jgi:hypothetical protein
MLHPIVAKSRTENILIIRFLKVVKIHKKKTALKFICPLGKPYPVPGQVLGRGKANIGFNNVLYIIVKNNKYISPEKSCFFIRTKDKPAKKDIKYVFPTYDAKPAN